MKWFDGLKAQAAAKVSVALARLELGNTSNIKWLSGLGEYRIDWGQGTGSIWCRMGTTSLCCSGAAQRHVNRDIEIARQLLKEYKFRR